MTDTAERENLKLLREAWELAPLGPEKDDALQSYLTALKNSDEAPPPPTEETPLEKAVAALK